MKIPRWVRRLFECNHEMSVIDSTKDGDLIVACSKCRRGWFTKIAVEGMMVRLSDSAVTRGCEYCRQQVYSEMDENKGKDQPDDIDFTCENCGEHWHLTAERIG